VKRSLFVGLALNGAVSYGKKALVEELLAGEIAVVERELWAMQAEVDEAVPTGELIVSDGIVVAGVVEEQRSVAGFGRRDFDGHAAVADAASVAADVAVWRMQVVDGEAVLVSPEPHYILAMEEFAKLLGWAREDFIWKSAEILMVREQ